MSTTVKQMTQATAQAAPPCTAGDDSPVIRAHPFGWLTPTVLAAAQRDPARLIAWLAATRADWHFAGLVLALAPDEAARAAIEPALFAEKRRDVLRRVCPDADKGLVSLTAKLAGPLWSAMGYRRLARLAEEPNARRVLLMARRITRRQVAGLLALPPAYRHPAILARLKRPGDAARILFAMDLVARVRPDLSHAAILRTLEQAPQNLPIGAWSQRHFRSAAFPQPPWAGTARLRPLRSWGEVQQVAYAFRNCIRSRVWEVLSGRAYLFVLHEAGTDRAVVEVVRVASGQWMIAEAKGPANAPLTARAEALLRAEMPGIPVLPDGAWVEDYCDPDG